MGLSLETSEATAEFHGRAGGNPDQGDSRKLVKSGQTLDIF